MANEREREGPQEITNRGSLEFAAIRERGKYAIDEENHRMWFRASNPGLQADGLDIPTSAWKKDIKGWLKKNPVFMPFHDYRLWSLGHGVDAEIDEEALRVQVEFAYGRNPEATMAWELYKHRDMNAVSVGFEILASEDAEYGEGDEKRNGRRVTRAKLLELSAVPLPMDEEALAERMKEYAGADPKILTACRSFACQHCQERFTRPGWEDNDNQVRYQIRPKSEFDEDTYVTLSLDVKGTKDVQIHRANYVGADDDGKKHAQSISFMKDAGWSLAEAKEWYGKHEEEIKKGYEPEPDVEYIVREDEDRIGKILELVTDIRTSLAALQINRYLPKDYAVDLLIAEREKKPTEIAEPQEPAYMPALRRVAAAIRLTPGEVMTELNQRWHTASEDKE